MPLQIKPSDGNVFRSTPLHELPQLLTEIEFAEYLALPPKKLVRLHYERRGSRTIRLGSTELIRREDLIAWIEAPSMAE